MSRKNSIGAMRHAVAFDERGTASDGAGGTSTNWVESFSCRAEFIHLRGGESVIASRLEGKHVQVIRVRAFLASKLVTTDWRVRNTRNSDVFNVRDITPSNDGRYLEFLCEKGVAV
ncbi:MAG: head-tail adaptor protein [Rhodobacteraceae bacterium]|nr:head-tail adaptor protein [Paracoccaceae bacterium]